MNRTTRIAVLAAALVVAASAVLIVIALAVGGGDDDTTPGAGTDAHVHITEAPAEAEPAEVAERALSTIFSWQPVSDASPGAALTRAEPWLTGTLAESAAAPTDPNVRPLPQWGGWKSSGDVVTATTSAQPPTVATDTKVILPVTVTQTVLHADGSSTPYSKNTIRTVVVATPDGWKVTEFTLTPAK
ncbi:hypothetical protein LRS58_20560 [Rhodococcus sp. BH2-1]|nr:hypothetical protein [Rhodococcus sp. BH2-1]